MGVPYTNTTLVPQVVYDYTMRSYTVLPGETVQIPTKYGPTVSERPAANTVPIGAVYMAVQTQQMWQSDGTQWVVIDATQMGQGPAGMEYYGATASERPAVADVPVGAVYMAVQTQELWQSDGAQWVVM